MSYLALCAAPFDNNEIQQPINSEKKRNGKNKTLKKAIKEPMENKAKKVTSATISNLHEQPENTDNSSLSTFTPPSSAKPSTMTEEDKDENEETNDHSQNKHLDSPVGLEEFTTIKSSQANDYFKQHIPYYTQMSEHPISSKDELLTKLDKILHLLEEHKDEQTGHVTEELVLYSFLGVFIIFIVDSFARAGKYMR